MSKHFVILLALALPVTSLAAPATPSFLKISNDIPAQQQALLLQDLGRLQNFSLNTQNAELSRVMDLPTDAAVTTQSLLQWLSLRVKLLVSGDFRMDSRTLSVAQRDYAFEQ